MQSILLVSKNRSITQLLEILLAQHSFVVRTETSFNEAFEELKHRGHYDLVLSLEDRTKQSAADLQRMVSKIAPYAKFVNLSGFNSKRNGSRSAAVEADAALDSCDVMDIIEEILRISLELKKNPQEPTTEEMKCSLYNTVYLLTSILNHHGLTHGTRCQETMASAVEVGKRFGFPQPLLDELAFSALLKDIGMIKVDPKIKQQPRKLTSEEYDVLKKHCVHGVNIIMKIKLPWDLKDNILCHHERFDGSGYPLGLHKHDIPIGARILATVDAYYSMQSERPYRPAMSAGEIMEEMSHNLGTQFDPAIGKEFLSIVNPEAKVAEPRGRNELRIAVIDDEEAPRAKTIEQLRRIGFNPFGLDGGYSALEYLNMNKVDVILCDLEMPGVDGYQLLHWLKQIPSLEGTPFILMSSSKRDTSDVVMGLEMGADDYIFKPFNDQYLRTKIQAVLERRNDPTSKAIPVDERTVMEQSSDRSMRLIKQLLKLKEETRTGELCLQDGGAEEGQIMLIRGQVRHATYKELTGEEAFYRLLGLERFESAFHEGRIPRAITITAGLDYLLIEGLRRLDEADAAKPLALSI